MRSKTILAFSIAFAACALLYPRPDWARTSDNAPTVNNNTSTAAAQREAALMVPAQATLEKAIDARKMQPGQQFQATLTETVHLKGGLELPRGTTLVGTIAKDKMQPHGISTLALRFTRAELKDGKAIPIQATIMGIAPPAYGYDWDQSGGQASPDPWNGKTLRIDELGALSGVDFHGSIAAGNSGVFVSTKRDNMKLSSGSQLSLAIAARGVSATKGGA